MYEHQNFFVVLPYTQTTNQVESDETQSTRVRCTLKIGSATQLGPKKWLLGHVLSLTQGDRCQHLTPLIVTLLRGILSYHSHSHSKSPLVEAEQI